MAWSEDNPSAWRLMRGTGDLIGPGADIAIYDEFNEADHPRGGDPDNAGRFSKGSGGGKAAKSARQKIRVAHGSPHKFDRFDLAHLGTGEGAGAYGPGLYFAEEPQVAENYRKAAPIAKVDGKDVAVVGWNALEQMAKGEPDEWVAKLYAAKALWSLGDNAKAELDGAANGNHEHFTNKTAAAEARKLLDEDRVKIGQRGYLYQVDLDLDPDEVIDWDKPLSEQPEVLKKLMRVPEFKRPTAVLNDGRRLIDVAKLFHPEVPTLVPIKVTTELNAGAGVFEAFRKVREMSKSPAWQEGVDKMLLYVADRGDGNLTVIKTLPEKWTGEQLIRNSWMPKDELMEKLTSVGLKGIKYFDQGSRPQAVLQAKATKLSEQLDYQIRILSAMRKATKRPEVQKQFTAEQMQEQISNQEKLIEGMRADLTELQKPQTHNYVVFDPDRINIVNREGMDAALRRLGMDADWEESKHPRDDDGKFATGSGGGGAGSKPLKSGDYVQANIGGRKTLIKLSSAPNDKGVLSGFKVNKGGERIETETKEAIQHHLVVFKTDDITSRMKMNNKYAELEPDETAEGPAPKPPPDLTSHFRGTRKRFIANGLKDLEEGLAEVLKKPPEQRTDFWEEHVKDLTEAIAESKAQLAEITPEAERFDALQQLETLQRSRGFPEDIQKKRDEAEKQLLEDIGGEVDWDKEYKSVADAVAKRLGFNADKIKLSDESKDFELGGKKYKYAGSANLQTGDVTLYKPHMGMWSIKPLTAHEIEHQKYQAFMWRVSNEMKRAIELTKEVEERNERLHIPGQPRERYPVMKPDGLLKPPYDQQFPAYQAWTELTSFDNGKKLRESDGVTDYSKEWWKAFENGEASSTQAYHETLAEMAHEKERRGKLPGSMLWKKLYRMVNSDWKESRAEFERAGSGRSRKETDK